MSMCWTRSPQLSASDEKQEVLEGPLLRLFGNCLCQCIHSFPDVLQGKSRGDRLWTVVWPRGAPCRHHPAAWTVCWWCFDISIQEPCGCWAPGTANSPPTSNGHQEELCSLLWDWKGWAQVLGEMLNMRRVSSCWAAWLLPPVPLPLTLTDVSNNLSCLEFSCWQN